MDLGPTRTLAFRVAVRNRNHAATAVANHKHAPSDARFLQHTLRHYLLIPAIWYTYACTCVKCTLYICARAILRWIVVIKCLLDAKLRMKAWLMRFGTLSLHNIWRDKKINTFPTQQGSGKFSKAYIVACVDVC